MKNANIFKPTQKGKINDKTLAKCGACEKGFSYKTNEVSDNHVASKLCNNCVKELEQDPKAFAGFYKSNEDDQ